MPNPPPAPVSDDDDPAALYDRIAARADANGMVAVTDEEFAALYCNVTHFLPPIVTWSVQEIPAPRESESERW